MSSAAQGMSEVIQQLAAAVAAAQHRLAAQERVDRDDFIRVLRLADDLGLGTLVSSLAPPTYSFERAECTSQVYLQRTRETGFAVRVSPLSLGFSRKYPASAASTHTFTVDVARVNSIAATSPAPSA